MTERVVRAWRSGKAAIWILWAIVVMGFVLRLWWAGQYDLWRRTNALYLRGDEPEYNNLALAILHGQGFDCPCRVPLYPAWLAFVHWITRESYTGIADLQSLLGLTVIPLTYALARRFFGRAASLIAAFLAAASYSLINLGFVLLSEVLYTPILLLLAIALVDAVRNPTTVRLALAGCLVGVSALVRPTLMLFPLFAFPLFAIAVGRKRALRCGAVFAAVAFLVMGSWVVRNYVRYHAVFPLATSNAFLWQGSPEYYHLVRDEGYPYTRIWSEIIYGPGWQKHDPGSIGGDRWWTRRALRSIAHHPGVYLEFAGEKLGTFWIGDPQADWNNTYPYDYNALRRLGYVRRDAILLMIDRVVPIVALVALFVLRRRWNALLPVLALLVYATLLHAATHAEARLSEPFRPFLLILIGGAFVEIIAPAVSRVLRRRRTHIPAEGIPDA
jgi:4-amino-4-deoxy-L-arabinose transferase-like glycosyltransferase